MNMLALPLRRRPGALLSRTEARSPKKALLEAGTQCMSKSRPGKRCPVSHDARADILVKSIFLGYVGSMCPIEGAPELLLLLLGDGEA